MRLMTCLAVAGALLAAGGCADAGDRGSAASEAALRLLTAAKDGDGAAACAVLAPDTAAAVSRSAGTSCAAAIGGAHLPSPATVEHVDVYGQWARVRLADDTVFLAAFPGGWRGVAAGCTSPPGDGERPYDCVVQGD